MSLSFNEIPSATRTPFTYIEFDSSGAIIGPTRKVYKGMIIGQKLPAGTAQFLTDYKVINVQQAINLFGEGSMLHLSVQAWLLNNIDQELRVIAVDDNEAGVAATASVKFNGAATKAGVLQLLLAGKKIQVPVVSGDNASSIATKVVTAISNAKSPISAEVDNVDQTKVNLTSKHKGEVGNDFDIRFNYYEGEEFPEGLQLPTIVPFTGGIANPSLENLIATLPEIQFEAIVSPYNDTENLTLWKVEMTKRWGPVLQHTGIVHTAKKGSYSQISAFGESLNEKSLVVFECHKMPSSPFEVASAMTATVLKSIAIDQARPVQTLQVFGLLPAQKKDLLRMEERNFLLHDGIATHVTDEFGSIKLERVITTYKKNAAGADDPSYLDIYPIYILDYLRYDLKNTLARKYPRHKLADDSSNTLPANVITPSVAKAEAVAKYAEWVELGLVEDTDTFKNNLVVERDVTNRNRLNWLLPPNLMNQLMINAVQFRWIL